MYPYGRSDQLCARYVDGYGHLPGGIRLPEESVAFWEWRERICVPDDYLCAAKNQDLDDWVLILLEYLRRIYDLTRRF